jgi:hypothetical protein
MITALLTIFLLCSSIVLLPSKLWGACHLYIVPQIGTGSGGDAYRPKYAGDLPVSWSGIRYGREGFWLVAADVSTAQDNAATAQPDVIRLPDNLDLTIGVNLTTVQNRLEAINIPSGWVSAGMTYRSVLRTVVHMMFFFQRFLSVNKVYTAFLSGAVSLDTTFNSLSATNKKRIQDTAASFGIDTSGISSSTLRQILKAVADTFQDRPIPLGCLTI